MKRLLVTSGLPYSNGRLHVGHIAGAYLPADIYVRYQRLLGRDVRFVCGSDDYGVANILAAQKEGKSPAELADHYNNLQQRDFAGIGISFDIYGSTSQSQYHTKASQDFFLRINEQGYFKKRTTKQFYDPERSCFLPDRFVKGSCGYCNTPDQNGDQCENCGKLLDVESLKDARSVMSGQPAIVKDTTHWFLDLSPFESVVSKWLETATVRKPTRNFVGGLISTGLIERAMTRDLSWGIPVPLSEPDAEGKVLYVWFDAPIGYVSNTMELCAARDGDAMRYTDWWKSEDSEIVHFIGEDNTIFHCMIWIAMLSAEGSFKLPSAVIVNQYLNIQFPGSEAEKISKSRGRAVWIGDYLESGASVDALRYYLTAIAPEKARAVYSPSDLIQRNNSDLADTLGNFVNRVISFSLKHCGTGIPEISQSKVTEVDQEFGSRITTTHREVTNLLNQFSFKQAQDSIIELGRAGNRYIDEKKPWVTRKDDLETTKVTMYQALNAIHAIGVMLSPFLPTTGNRILEAFAPRSSQLKWDQATLSLSPGSQLKDVGILFTKEELPA